MRFADMQVCNRQLWIGASSCAQAHKSELCLQDHLKLPKKKGFAKASHLLLMCRYTIGKVIGAGSFGVVREAVHKRTNLHYACKTIPKLPKKGRAPQGYS